MSASNLLFFARPDTDRLLDAADLVLERTAKHVPMPWAGECVAVSGSLTTPLDTGSIQVRVTVNGVAVGPVLNLTSAVQSEVALIPIGDVAFLAGDGIGAEYDATPEAAGAVVAVTIWVEFS